jgi:hypothetical protein
MPSSPPHPCQARPHIHAKLAAAGLGLGMPLPAASANGNGTAEQNSCFSKQDAMPFAFRAWKCLQISAVTCASVRTVFSFCEILVLKYFRGLTMLYICTFPQTSIYLAYFPVLQRFQFILKKNTARHVPLFVIANMYNFYMGFVMFFIYSFSLVFGFGFRLDFLYLHLCHLEHVCMVHIVLYSAGSS